MARWEWIPQPAWLRIGLIAVGLALALALIALRSRRVLWPAVGICILSLPLVMIARGPFVRLYTIGCGIHCGGVVFTDLISLGLNVIIVAALYSLPRSRVRIPFQIAGAAALSFALLSITTGYMVA
jgi:hypothetical protein